jgi:hypothetical protein
VQAHLSEEEQELMRRLLRSGLAKNRTKAIKIGIEAVLAAGIAADVVACAGIGTAVLPVIGTAIGAALGAIWLRNRRASARDEMTY